MCGIAGYFDVNSRVGDSSLKDMISCLTHRGPDAQGSYHYKDFHLGHTRLSIIDLRSESNQPFVSNCGDYVIVFNGEVYNYQELKVQHNLKCRTLSDTEVILELFIKYGLAHVNMLNGMFSYVILDKRTEHLHVFRDRMGVKPLFYFYKHGFFAFASEIKALRKIPVVKNHLSVNHAAVNEFLRLGYIPEPHSIYNEIRKFPAGSWGRLDADFSIGKYWSLETQIKAQLLEDESEAEKTLEGLLEDSTKHRLIADVPVGVFLSGGVDSSLVSALASRLHSSKIKSFTIGFKDGKYDESKHAKKVAAHLGTDHYEWVITEKEVFKNLDHIYDIYDEPFADQSMLPSLAVCHLASKEVKVVLTGDGGDESFLGYGGHSWAKRLQNPILMKNRKMVSKVLSMLKSRHKRVGELLNFNTHEEMAAHIHSKENGYFSDQELQRLVYKHHTYTGPNFTCAQRNLLFEEQQALFDSEVYLRDDLLVKMDRASMHYSIEARSPLLDYRIIEFANNLDPQLRKKGPIAKYLLKKILHKYVPRELIERPKWGFTVPLNDWLQNDLSYLKADYLNERIIKDFGLVDYDEVNRILKSHQSGKPYKIQQVWALILLHKWLKEQL